MPIYRIDFSDESQKAAHDAIVEKVHAIERLNARMIASQNSTGKRAIQRAIEVTETELSSLIDALYGIEGLRVMETDEGD